MTIAQTTFLGSPIARTSLKRGYARQAISHARSEADMPAIFEALRAFRPNRKSVDRMGARIAAMRGVVAVTRTKQGGLVVITRNVREVTTAAAEVRLFDETALVYSRFTVGIAQGKVTFDLCRASFSLHALERLIERSDVALNPSFLGAVDAEAAALLRGVVANKTITDDGDSYVPARQAGLWAGSEDRMSLEPDWQLVGRHGDTIPVFSVRTFLGPDEMRPMVWLKWNAA